MTVLVVAAHPDDEALGCGATMARHAAEGDIVNVLFVADGETGRTGSGEREIGMRNDAAERSARALGVAEWATLGLPDNRLDTVPLLQIAQAVEVHVAKWRPRIVYTHHGGDLNVDHRVTHQAVLTACRPLTGTTVGAIYAFEVMSSTEWGGCAVGPVFVPNRFVDVAPFWASKERALEAYAGEMRPFPHPRSLEAVSSLARWRGASAGLPMAEAFMVVRETVQSR